MRGHNICFYAIVTKIICNYHQILPHIKSSGYGISLEKTVQSLTRLFIRTLNVHLGLPIDSQIRAPDKRGY